MLNGPLDDIVLAVKDIIAGMETDLRYVPKYGGEVLALDPKDDSKFVGGIFIYKDHVSLEFSNGASFEDPKGQLEGKGKFRRHLKFAAVRDVQDKDVRRFLEQAFAG
ncbi:DUF1801 domain-containing protein [Roseovarius sp. LXJ103]|uniref:DUF1801 domain-containing protein n=1 Tax=Roseovarius carneus TaxID=2853164 RepID=UPI001C62A73E|nr:DUF1801 domain-containing protein [Roseovarius carneus]MBZ8117242.1 DUF1801 domain-containing protein [Roseovarius carneus]